MQENIGKLVQSVPTFTAADVGMTIYTYFEENIHSEGIVVLDIDTPVGLIMRNDFYQKIGKQYGFTLFIRRSITLIMNKDLLIVDSMMDTVDASIMAMNRAQENMYDFIIVTENGKYAGVVSIKLFIYELSKKREKEIELLKEQQETLLHSNEMERQHVLEMKEINYELNLRNESVKNLMDNAGQGFLSFDTDLIISNEYSIECTRIFQTDIKGLNFMNLISGFLLRTDIRVIESVLQSLFKVLDKRKDKIYLSLLPKELNIKERIVKFEYKSIGDSENRRIMLILTDITDKKILELKMQEQRKELKLILKAISNKSDFIAAIEDYKDFFGEKCYEILGSNIGKKEIISEIFRVIHTFKGDFSYLCLFNTSSQMHQIEDTILKFTEDIDSISMASIHEYFEELDYLGMMESDLKIIYDTIGPDYLKSDRTYPIREEMIVELEKKIMEVQDTNVCEELLHMVRKLRHMNVKDILAQYNDSIRILSEKLGKKVADIHFIGDDIYIDKNKYRNVIKTLVHIFRNAIDHGIETSEERVLIGKPDCGNIYCSLKDLQNETFVLSIRDDGKGVSREAIINKAIEKKMIDESKVSMLSKKEITDIIFKDDFSTSKTVTVTSGRGAGLAAVKSEVLKLGGDIYIESEPGQYTEFFIQLPVLD